MKGRKMEELEVVEKEVKVVEKQEEVVEKQGKVVEKDIKKAEEVDQEYEGEEDGGRKGEGEVNQSSLLIVFP